MKRHEAAGVDRLTGAFNRRQLDADIESGLSTGGTPNATMTAAMRINVDQFSNHDSTNHDPENRVTTHEAATGDQVLEGVAWVIMATARTTDVVYRRGPSTFCVLLPSTGAADAVILARRSAANIDRLPLLAGCGVSVTAGIAVGHAADVADAVERAVDVLDHAIRSGRPCIWSANSNGTATVEAIDEMVSSDDAEVPRDRSVPAQTGAPADAVGGEIAPPVETPLVPPIAAPLGAINALSGSRSGR